MKVRVTKTYKPTKRLKSKTVTTTLNSATRDAAKLQKMKLKNDRRAIRAKGRNTRVIARQIAAASVANKSAEASIQRQSMANELQKWNQIISMDAPPAEGTGQPITPVSPGIE